MSSRRVDDMRDLVRAQMKALDSDLRGEIKTLGSDLWSEMSDLRSEMNAGDVALRTEMRAGFAEMKQRLGVVLSKLDELAERVSRLEERHSN